MLLEGLNSVMARGGHIEAGILTRLWPHDAYGNPLRFQLPVINRVEEEGNATLSLFRHRNQLKDQVQEVILVLQYGHFVLYKGDQTIRQLMAYGSACSTRSEPVATPVPQGFPDIAILQY